MAIIKIKRPELTLMDKLYLPAVFKGLWITWKHAWRSMRGTTPGAEQFNASGTGITMQYPETRWDDHLPEYYRGAPTLVTDEQNRERCVSCQLCEFICPPKAITIIPGEIDSDDPWAKVEKRPQEFEIDMTRCIYCGMCEEVCPEQAIFLRKDYLFIATSREELVHDKAKLYEIGGVREGLVNKWNELK